MPAEFTGLARPDEADEIIEDLRAKLIRTEDERDIYKQALGQIAAEDFRGPKPQAVAWAELALNLVKSRYGR